jgi:glycosyltransferase involved in cell wall biosynthesis
VILFVGRFIRLKGVLELLQAARILPQYEFWLIGRSYGGGSIKLPSLPNVRNLGFQENVVPFYARARICAFPSHRENFPSVGLEAMACGKAIVATDLGFSEYIENGREGLLIKPFDVQGLVNSIRSLMENDEMRKTFERNARTKAEQYDWNVVLDRYKALYKSL